MSICCVNAVLNFSGRVLFVSVHRPVLDSISVGSFFKNMDPFGPDAFRILFGFGPTRPDVTRRKDSGRVTWVGSLDPRVGSGPPIWTTLISAD